MKKTVGFVSALIFSLTLMLPSLMWADDGKHMEEGSGMKMDKSSHEGYEDKKHAEDYQEGEVRMKEGSARKEPHDKNADHKKMEEGSGMDKTMEMSAPRNEGS